MSWTAVKFQVATLAPIYHHHVLPTISGNPLVLVFIGYQLIFGIPVAVVTLLWLRHGRAALAVGNGRIARHMSGRAIVRVDRQPIRRARPEAGIAASICLTCFASFSMASAAAALSPQPWRFERPEWPTPGAHMSSGTMQFTCDECTTPPAELSGMFLFGILVGSPLGLSLLVWLRRGPNRRDRLWIHRLSG
jgi:hypothetical protein